MICMSKSVVQALRKRNSESGATERAREELVSAQPKDST